MTSLSTPAIRGLNDQHRKKAGPGWTITAGVQAEGSLFVARAVQAVQSFSDFTPDNDPYGEHDFGAFTLDGQKLFWKIDYYDPSLTFGSEDPADPVKTRRVLTIMLASEY